MKKSVIATFISLLTLTGLAQTHFTVEGTGNPLNSMTIYISSATIAGLKLEAGDEIAIFDGEICVGMTELSDNFPNGNPPPSNEMPYIIARKEDGENPGYSEGNKIRAKMWDVSAQEEYSAFVEFRPESSHTVFTDNSSAIINISDTYFNMAGTAEAEVKMNFYILSATVGGTTLKADDEIAVFDGIECAGTYKLTEELTEDNSSFVTINARKKETGISGYTPGNEITVKLYDADNSLEYNTSIEFLSDENSTSDEVFTDMGGAYIRLTGVNTWTGATGSTWTSTDNWSPARVPAGPDNAWIPDVSNAPVIGPDNQITLNDLTVESGASLTIASNASGTGSLIIDGTVSGIVTAQRHLTADEWHIVSAPVQNQGIQNLLTNGNNNVAYKDEDGGFYGVTTYSEADNDWDAYFTGSTTGDFTNGTGYLFRRQTSDGVVTFTGTPATGDVTVPVTLKETGFGWNCIGNPYPSAIGANNSATSTTDFLTHNSAILDDSYEALYAWDPTANSGAGDYVIINHAGIGNGIEEAWVSNYLQSGQGFIVRANADGNVTFTTDMQSHQPAQTFKSAEMPWSKAILTVNRNGEKTSTTLAFNDAMSKGLDPGYDAGIFRNGNDLCVYTQLVEDNGVDFGLQCLPVQNMETLKIPVGVDAATGGEITFSVQQENLPAGVVPVLNDKLLGTQIAFTGSGEVYTAPISENTKGYGRFTLTFSSTTDAAELQNSAIRAWYSNGKIIIHSPTTPKTKVALYDTHGRKVMERKLQNTNRNEITLEGVTTGVYFLRIMNGDFQETIKIPVTQIIK